MNTRRGFFLLTFLLLSQTSHSFAASGQVSGPSFIDKLVLGITNPWVVTILLCIASLGIVGELFSPRIGIGGIVSFLAMGIFYFGHIEAGYASGTSVLLVILGIVLIVLEFLLPGGIVGILGFSAIIVSLLFSGPNTVHMAFSILTALVVAVIGMVIMMKLFGKKLNMFNKMVLTDVTDTEHGYVSNVNREDLKGKVAFTSTPLRPAGTIMLDGERIDVVSEGAFIDAHKKVTIIKVEGARIVVREID